MTGARLKQFEDNCQRARDLVGLGQSLGSLTQGLVDSSDLFRAALTQAVAALDSYVHGVVLDRAVEILLGQTAPARSSTRVGLHFNAVREIVGSGNPIDREITARTHIAQRLALETFQKPDDVGNAMAMVGINKVWTLAFSSNIEQIKKSLGLIVARRNQIVHSCDADPLMIGEVTPISSQDALDAVDVVEKVVHAIDKLL
ncbi:hypothetical protein ACGFOW_32980 [Streptomyces rubiginosohelvolus]|uniref:hypothetical protein n=1 Tax=Streptomyces rubiginosohelvolus TaxID=67362 RepID=UPI0037178478